jgi:hypothetical protein
MANAPVTDAEWLALHCRASELWNALAEIETAYKSLTAAEREIMSRDESESRVRAFRFGHAMRHARKYLDEAEQELLDAIRIEYQANVEPSSPVSALTENTPLPPRRSRRSGPVQPCPTVRPRTGTLPGTCDPKTRR